MHEQKVIEIIAQLKEIRNAKGYTYQRIFDMVEESGGHVSLATIKRVFADGSEEKNFRYEDSIRPIAIALIGIDPTEPQEGQSMSIAEMEANTLRKIALHKEDLIQEMHGEIQRMQEENQRLQEEYATRINYLKEESKLKSEHIATLTEQHRRKDKSIFWLTMILIVISLLIIVSLIIDRVNPDLGYIWRSASEIVQGHGVSGLFESGAGNGLLL